MGGLAIYNKTVKAYARCGRPAYSKKRCDKPDCFNKSKKCKFPLLGEGAWCATCKKQTKVAGEQAAFIAEPSNWNKNG